MRLFSARIIFLLLLLMAIGQALYYYPLLPDTVAAHFGPSGKADGWMTKDVSIAVDVGLFVFMTVLFSSISIFIKNAKSGINVPNKEYWLAPERREETVQYMVSTLNTIGIVVLCFLLMMFEITYRANLVPDRTQVALPSGMFFIGVGLFITFDMVMIIRLMLRFSKIPKM